MTKNHQQMSDRGNLKEIYSQHWQHIRHIENERLAFTSFYIVLLGASLAYVFKSNGLANPLKYIILGLLLFFSFLGFLFMVRVRITFWYHYKELKRITPLLCRGEKLDYELGDKEFFQGVLGTERRQKEVKNQIVEGPLWLERIYACLYKKVGLGLPLTLIFPAVFLLGFIVGFIGLILLLVFKTI